MSAQTLPDVITTPVTEYGETAAALAVLQDKYKDAVFHTGTPSGDKAARAARLELVSLRTSLDKMRKALNEGDQARIKLRNDEAKRITSVITSLEEPIDAQIKAEEARKEADRAAKAKAEQERVAKIRGWINGLTLYPSRVAGKSSDEIGAALNKLVLLVIGIQYEEFADEAEAARAAAIETLEMMRVSAYRMEEQAAELEQQRATLEAQRAIQEQEAAKARAELEAERKALENAKPQINEPVIEAPPLIEANVTETLKPVPGFSFPPPGGDVGRVTNILVQNMAYIEESLFVPQPASEPQTFMGISTHTEPAPESFAQKTFDALYSACFGVIQANMTSDPSPPPKWVSDCVDAVDMADTLMDCNARLAKQ